MLIRKTHDYIHHYHGWRHEIGSCRIEIFQQEGCPPVIICTELTGGADSSVSVMTEHLAAEVVRKHFPAAFEQIGEPFVWIDYQPPIPAMGVPSTYRWVTFDSYAPRLARHDGGMPRVALGRAHWTPIDRVEIEQLVAARRATPDRGMPLVAAGQHTPWEHEGAGYR
jgi:hypothetical protein